MAKKLFALSLILFIFLMGCDKTVTISGNTSTPSGSDKDYATETVTLPAEANGKILDYGFALYGEPELGEEIAVMHTSMGDLCIRFFPDAAPLAVTNFKELATSGYYDGIIFHRVIEDFMIQGGDPSGTGYYGDSFWGQDFNDEFNADARNFCGALSMANIGYANTNSSQFFIVQLDTVSDDTISQMEQIPSRFSSQVIDVYRQYGGTPALDYKHTVFGFVFYGMETVDKIAVVKTDSNDKPLEDVVINSIDIVYYGGIEQQ
ncbi:MAG TPA: peptidylprolyl isomerase [Oscillospiraceae bacterium]|nr:peptidylprolyl isomerase [Oscillospiraceae bacterium]HPF55409.1 peptidylprolyl isomerase [Clostridiales bacterium]HPK35620.1 peptidylprolyl isomerase [Oscillospiraceae bacterium]HPR74684.1 peptidylprolyl isomerase [Oscillospiraceae bacterium]